MRELDAINLPGNFLVLKDALVIIDLEMETVDGVMATLMPIGPSHGWPEMGNPARIRINIHGFA